MVDKKKGLPLHCVHAPFMSKEENDSNSCACSKESKILIHATEFFWKQVARRVAQTDYLWISDRGLVGQIV